MNIWLHQHLLALRRALKRLWQTPLNTLLSLLVMGIAIMLPAAGYVVLDNLKALGKNAAGVQQISIFMALDTPDAMLEKTRGQLNATVPEQWQFIPREDALERLKTARGMAEIIASLPRNPLPHAFVIEPKDTDPATLETLSQSFSQWPGVAHVQLDSAWIKRFDAFLQLGKLTVSLLSALFATGLVAVTFNTIRLQILAQAEEIEVARLVGATDAFIRRPFYYSGILQGGLAGLAAGGLISLGLHILAEPVTRLAELYGSHFELHGLTPADLGLLTLIGATLGWVGAQLSVSLSLRQFD